MSRARAAVPFTLSLSKGSRGMQGFDRLSPNGVGSAGLGTTVPFTLSLSKGPRGMHGFDRFSPNGAGRLKAARPA